MRQFQSSKSIFLALFLAVAISTLSNAQTAQITEKLMEFNTYSFSDPDPIPEINRIYPYFYFHGFTNNPVLKKWKMVVLENEYIKVYVCPEIGGKVWGAIEKSTGKEFLYFNHVVKFRDVGMRGPWVSGGLEYNFGDIGHIPTGATPVDYVINENSDGSVSCVVGAIDLPSGTKWNVEIKVSPGKAFFETKTTWFNRTELPCTYYHWMNAAAKASNSLELIYPGNNWIGHGTETGSWPNENRRKINWYKENNFGEYKSYHVINAYADYFGGYYHDENFGFGHLSDFDEKPGKKLWLWGLSPQGMIWENLLSDTDGQYIEFQAGKLFNQAANGSTKTPFKHKEFAPHDVDVMQETWFPLVGVDGMVAASQYGVLNVTKNDESQSVLFSPLQKIYDEIIIFKNGKEVFSEQLILAPLELYKTNIKASVQDEIKITIGQNKVTYSSKNPEKRVNRPFLPNEDFNWNSAYGLFTKGLEYEKQRNYALAKETYEQSLKIEPAFVPALNRLAQSFYRQMNYHESMKMVQKSLAVDNYNGESNYLLGLLSTKMSDVLTAKSGFSIAMGDIQYRSAASTELAKLFLIDGEWDKAIRYSQKAIAFNKYNIDAFQTMAISQRKLNNNSEALKILNRINELDATNHFQRFERWLISNKNSDKQEFINKFKNELPHESFLDLGINYYNKGCTPEAIKSFELAPKNPIIDLWLAYLNPNSKIELIKDALAQSPDFVLPHRQETANMLLAIMKKEQHWKLNYYLGLALWSNGLTEKAKEQFVLCGDRPDYAPFYLAKMKLIDSKPEQLKCINTAMELEPGYWRTARDLANYYNNQEQADKALEIIAPFVKTQPEQSAVGLCYAETLNMLHDYNETISFLESYNVLPFEGATQGRDLYREACIRSAIELLQNKKYNKTIQLIKKAKSWPANLGVGRPYDVDERLEDYILTLSYEKKGDKENATAYKLKVTDYQHPAYKQENSNLYLQLQLLAKNGNTEKATELLDKFSNTMPNNSYIKWVKAKYTNQVNTDQIESTLLDVDTPAMPFDPKHVDRNFQILLDFLNIVGN